MKCSIGCIFGPACVLAIMILLGSPAPARGELALGIDVSDWQNQTTTGLPIDWVQVHRPVSQGGGGKDFAFIRSSRGGTTGTYNEHTREGTLSHRYDDWAFEYNITQARAVGVLAGPYHFGRADIVSYQMNNQTVIHTGTDEANHMLQQAGHYMRPGYLRPVFDLEAGDVERSTEDLTDFALDFANRIYEVKGIYPLVYINSYYANTQVDSRITVMDLWIARWPNQANPGAIDINGDPPAAPTYPNVYGVWNPAYPQIPDPTPWKFWQYTSNGHVPGIGDGVTDRVDLDVAHGDIEYVKDFLVPALWTQDAGGQWTVAANWNGNPDLPGPDDRVIIDRAAGDYLISLESGAHAIRSLSSSERLFMYGGMLSIQQYAHLNNAATFSGGAMSSGSLMNNAALLQSAGTITTGVVIGSGSITVSGGQFVATSIRQPVLVISGNGSVRIGGVSGASGTSRLAELSIIGSGRLDLTDSAMVIDYDTSSPYALIRALVQLGYNAGAWDGIGIYSSTAAADSAYGIGVAEASELPGVPVVFRPADQTAVLVRTTRWGDANLDGAVTLEDFNLFAAHFGSGTKWSEGDFNYDGIVNLQDFNQLASNFGLSASPDGPTTQDWAALAAAVPEPGMPALVGLSLVALLRGRRRTHRSPC